MQVLHFANLTQHSEPENVQLCVCVCVCVRICCDTLGLLPCEPPRGVLSCVFVSVCAFKKISKGKVERKTSVNSVHRAAAKRPQGVKDFYCRDELMRASADTDMDTDPRMHTPTRLR